MSIHAVVSGSLAHEPQQRSGSKAPFTIATIRSDDEYVSVVAFGSNGERLLEFAKGEPIAVSGRAKSTRWVGRDGVEKHGISLVVDQLISAKPRDTRKQATPYARTRPTIRTDGRTLANDGVDDLWQPDVGATP
jgi:single-stranded DNA-binding protein